MIQLSSRLGICILRVVLPEHLLAIDGMRCLILLAYYSITKSFAGLKLLVKCDFAGPLGATAIEL